MPIDTPAVSSPPASILIRQSHNPLRCGCGRHAAAFGRFERRRLIFGLDHRLAA